MTPKNLIKGDTIAIVATARKITKEELRPALNLIEKWGLKVKLGKTIGAEDNQFAGEDSLRTQDFQEMLDDEDVKAIWCARGGYGTIRIVDGLDFSKFRKNPKWIIGYSDITVLHSHIFNFGIETLHAQMPLEIEKKTEETSESIRKVLFGEDYTIEVENRGSFASPGSFATLGRASGKLTGGNLSVLYSLIGSPSFVSTKNTILFIEDLDEMLYHIDRMMMNLKRSGILKNLKGLIVGGMTDMRDNTIHFGKTAEEIINDAVREYDFPVCYHFPAGHISDNRSLIMGREVVLNVTEAKVELTFSASINQKSAINNR